MKAGVFTLLLLVSGGIMFAQSSDTQGFTVNVTAPSSSTGNLLTGKTPATLTTLPSGWSLLCKQDYEAGNTTACAAGGNSYANTTWTTAAAHGTGTHSTSG